MLPRTAGTVAIDDFLKGTVVHVTWNVGDTNAFQFRGEMMLNIVKSLFARSICRTNSNGFSAIYNEQIVQPCRGANASS